jgi:hypothetical protein
MGLVQSRAQRGLIVDSAGAPSAGTSEVQTLTVNGTPTGGSFKLKFQGRTTAAIAYNANAAAIQAALEALPNIGAGNVAVAGTGPFTVTFQGNLAKKAVATMTLAVNALTGGTTPTVAIAKTTGTATSPTWTVVGAQT